MPRSEPDRAAAITPAAGPDSIVKTAANSRRRIQRRRRDPDHGQAGVGDRQPAPQGAQWIMEPGQHTSVIGSSARR